MRWIAFLCILLSGCTSTLNLPSGFDKEHTVIVADDNDPDVVIDGLSGKGKGATVGGASGAGAGIGFAAIACMPAFMFYGACLAIAAPTLGGVGAASGAAIGAIVTDSAIHVKEKQEMLDESLAAIDARQYLATLISQEFQRGEGVVLLDTGATSVSVQPEWTMRIAFNEISTIGSGAAGSSGNPYFLEATATLEILQAGMEKPVSRKEYHARTKKKNTTSEWQASEEPVTTVIEYLLATIAGDMMKDLSPGQLSLEKPYRVKPLYAKPTTNETKPDTNTLLASIQFTDPVALSSVNHDNANFAQFDADSGINWIIVDSSPVDLSTANRICGSLDLADKKKYTVPTLQEFEIFWQKYRNDERIGIFKKKEYCTSDTTIYRNHTATFSFADGGSGQQYTANLACISR